MSERLSDQTMRRLIDREVKEMLRRIDEDARKRYHLDASSSSVEVLDVDTASESDGNDHNITFPDRLSKPYGVNLEASTSPAQPIFNHMVTMEDFDRFTVALGDYSFKQEVISYLASFGGEETPTFVERIFSALFADEITFHLTFIGRQKSSRSLFGSAVYEVIFEPGIRTIVQIGSSWKTPSKRLLGGLETVPASAHTGLVGGLVDGLVGVLLVVSYHKCIPEFLPFL
ncbi:unnamed protein product [Dibothriocephalus latus]|uniref:DUF4806 domain-containing protein n=1 Tax=Dibothriocephalus latus TaxID=60516 RepID=A0A3P7LQK9_DIBLA|nr:unnamed protein product [Dibothriocephalus latus]